MILFLALVTLPACAEVKITQADDRSVQVTTGVYAARIDAKGNLSELTVKGAKAFTHQFGNPGKPPAEAPSITVTNNLVAVRSDVLRVEWTFGEETIAFLTEGYNFECTLDATVKALVAPGGGGGALGKYNGGTTAIVLANDLTVASTAGMHVHERRYLPGGYTSGGVKPGSLVENELRLGAPADAVQTLSSISIMPVGSDAKPLMIDGNQGSIGSHYFPDPKKIAFTFSQQNLGKTPVNLEYRAVVFDHRVAANTVASLQRKATLAGESAFSETWTLPELSAGFFYLVISGWRGETKLVEAKLTFAVDLPHYRHPLTRPADFTAFWERQNARLTATPLNPKVVLISTPENPNKAYDVTLDMPDGSTVHGCLVVPEKIGKGPTQFGSLMTGPLNDLMTKAKAPDFKPAENVAFTIALPEEGTYTTWKDAEHNNLLQCILVWLRGIDFIASRPEVNPQRIMVKGASRTGGLTLIVAALRAKNVCAANGFVHTSCGISWEEEPYLGWGKCPDSKNPVAMKLFCQQAAYVDPVNFAPDVKCPTILAYGIDDVFSPPQGIEAAYHLLGSKWKRISRDEGGHQYSPGCQNIQKQLTAYLDAGGATGPDQSRTLTDH
jgi:cephalosporin-C deacetylase-like acetyl esterase